MIFLSKFKYYRYRYLKFSILIFSVLLIAGCLFPKPLALSPDQEIRGWLRIDKPVLYKIGDLIPVTLTVEAKTGLTFQMPNLNGAALGGLELKKQSPLKTEKLRDGFRQSVQYLLTGWQVGKFILPAINIEYANGLGTKETLQLPSLNIKIVSVLPKGKSEAELLSLQIKDLKKPLGLPPRSDLLRLFLAAIFIFALITIFIWARLKKRNEQRIQAELEAIKVEPAHIIALRRLEYLKAANYLAQGDFKAYYSELSECLREYMENRYQIRALEMTTEEFLAHLMTSNYLPEEYQMVVRSFLTESDLVKFAKQMPAAEDNNQAIFSIEQLIEATKEMPESTNINDTIREPSETAAI